MKIQMITLLTFLVSINFSCADQKAAPHLGQILETPTIAQSADAQPSTMADSNMVAMPETSTKEVPASNIEIEKSELLSKKTSPKKIEIDKREKQGDVTEEVEADRKQENAETESAKLEPEVENPALLKNEEALVEVTRNAAVEKEEEIKVEEKPNHTIFNGLLQQHVSSSGVVDYQGLKGDISKLDAYLKDLESNSITSEWSNNEQLAYWINAYNAFTIKLILDNYPVKSIQDIANGKPWDKKWITLGGKTYSLNEIENDIIRPQFKEPRIHFAVNCAALSCPPLANKAYTAGNLNALLEKQTKSFVNNKKYNQITANSVKISKIFDWYSVDFGDKVAFLNKYADVKIKNGTSVEYSNYDWGLNNK